MTLLFTLAAEPGLEAGFSRAIEATPGRFQLHQFPDGESWLKVESDCRGEHAVILSHLQQPNPKVVPLMLLAETVRELGARRVTLVAPYLAYMRQDRAFSPGEAVSSRHFAGLISHHFDALLTLDPHLHRYASLSEIYSIPAVSVEAAPAVAEWLNANVRAPLVIGPDAESEQWARRVAEIGGLPYTVMDKVRHGDTRVSVSGPPLAQWAGHTPVLVDDIVASGATMAEAAAQLRAEGLASPLILALHAAFAEGAQARLEAAGVQALVSCNSIPHSSNAIDVSSVLAAGLGRLESN